MKENVFDVLVYLFENYMDRESDSVPDPDVIRTELLEAGFERGEVSKAFEWMESLAQQQESQAKATSAPAFRVFCKEEAAKLDVECRGLLLFLEQNGILTPRSRELAIDRVMALEEEKISLEHVKWVVLMILFCLPDEDTAFATMENLVYNNVPLYRH